MNFSRQVNVFKPEEFKTPVHVIGAGATGSWLTLMLGKMGVKDITVYDFDTVEEHNIPNQFFDLADVGNSKVDSLQRQVMCFSDIQINAKKEPATSDTDLAGVVFMLTDTMESRKEIFDTRIKYNCKVKLLVETRMDLRGGRIYTINPLNSAHVEEYEKTLYTDGESEVSACGTSQSIVATAALLASKAVWKLIKWHNKEYDQINNEIIFDVYNNTIIRRFGEWS